MIQSKKSPLSKLSAEAKSAEIFLCGRESEAGRLQGLSLSLSLCFVWSPDQVMSSQVPQLTTRIVTRSCLTKRSSLKGKVRQVVGRSSGASLGRLAGCQHSSAIACTPRRDIENYIRSPCKVQTSCPKMARSPSHERSPSVSIRESKAKKSKRRRSRSRSRDERRHKRRHRSRDRHHRR